jgi:hypothetical protein
MPREAPWGRLAVVRAGIGVEVLAGQRDNYVDFIDGVLRSIAKIDIGEQLLTEFDPGYNKNFKVLRNTPQGVYDELTVVIQQPPAVAKMIQTKATGGRQTDAKGTKIFGPVQIPAIFFFDQPEPNTPIHLSTPFGPIVIRHDDIIHPDFAEPSSLDVVLFHELCHAYYDQLGTADDLKNDDGSNFRPITPDPQPADRGEYVEEQLVSGLRAGRALKYCENTYRLRAHMALRRKYQAVGIGDDPDVESKWAASAKFADPAETLAANGIKTNTTKWRSAPRHA